MIVATYTPAALSQSMLVAYLLGVAAFYSWAPLPGILTLAALPAMIWFVGSWVIGLAQLLYGAIRWRKHPAISGALTLAEFGAFVMMIDQGWLLTV